MTASLVLAMPPGSVRDSLAERIASHGVTVACADPADVDAVRDSAGGSDALVHVAAADPFEAADLIGATGVATIAEAAAVAGARLLFCSSVLIYEDGGDLELTAGDPELAPPLELRSLAEAELEVFGSRAEVMVLRLGALLVPGAAASRSLMAQAERRSAGDARQLHLPLLDLDSLAATIASAAASRLHGAWDVVSACPSSGELFGFVADLPASGQGQEVGAPSGEDELRLERLWAEHAWTVSRLVTGDALREAGVPAGREWREFVAEALA